MDQVQEVEAKPKIRDQATPNHLGDGLDWPMMFPVGPSREALFRVLRLALEEVNSLPNGVGRTPFASY